MEYPKIQTLFERKEDFSIDITKIKRPVYETIKEWDVTEKVDGTNIRVMFTPGSSPCACPMACDCAELDMGGKCSEYCRIHSPFPMPFPGCTAVIHGEGEHNPTVRFGGRTDKANTPGDLLQSLASLFPVNKLASQFQSHVILYGEGYGAGIQKVGKLYRPDKSFILFDVLVDGKWWLDTKAVADVARQLGCDVVPYLGRMTLDEIIGLVQRESWSDLAATNLCPREGIVARPIETLFDSRHERVILKLKTSDFKAGKR